MLTTTALFVLSLGSAHAGDIPKADYKLKLDEYNIQMADYQFPSGLRVIFQEEHSQPIVAITTVIDTGSEADQEGMDGIAHVLEHLAFRAKHGDLPKNWDFIQQMGAVINASTSVDWTDYMTIAPVDSLIPLLRIEAKRISDGVANVTEKDVHTEVEIARNELRMRYENAAVGEAWDAISQQLFTPEWTYYRSTIGSHETLSNITLEGVQEYAATNYVPANTTIVVIGDFHLEDAGEIINKAFGDIPELLVDPENPDGELQLTESVSRIDCGARKAPPAPNPAAEIPRVRGMVENETVVLGWSLPGGYCDDENVMGFAASQLGSYIAYHLVPDWEWNDDEQSFDSIGCFIDPGQYASSVLCFIEPSAKYDFSAERLVEKAKDALYLQWQKDNPMYKPFIDASYNQAKMSSIAGMLQGLDQVASLGGRATTAAHFTHFTADPRFFTTNMNQMMTVEQHLVQAMAEKYLVRDRMVAVIVEPLDAEERARREANATQGTEDRDVYTGSTREKQYEYAFELEDLIPENIRAVTITPDVERIRSVMLDNGLRVNIMPYGTVPLVHVGLKVRGGDVLADSWDLDSFTEALSYRGDGQTERVLAVAGFYGEGQGTLSRTLEVSGSSGNLEALLHKVRGKAGMFDWQMAGKSQQIKSWEGSFKGNGEDPETWASRLGNQRLFVGHPLGRATTRADYDIMRAYGVADVKRWAHTKYQPANAELYIVGKLDADVAEAAVRKFFDGWEPADDVVVGRLGALPAPEIQPDRQVLIFDKPIATQTDVLLGCQLNWTTADQDAAAYVLGDTLDEDAWRRLREDQGVTYGAGVYATQWEPGVNKLVMTSIVQNNAVGFAVETFFGLLEDVAGGGEIDPHKLGSVKMSRARKYVLGHQSGSSMLGRLMTVDEGDFDKFNRYADGLANVTSAGFADLLSTCVDHEVVTIVGPKEFATAQLDEKGIAYTVVDWEALHLETLTEKERKKKAKADAKKEKEDAK